MAICKTARRNCRPCDLHPRARTRPQWFHSGARRISPTHQPPARGVFRSPARQPRVADDCQTRPRRRRVRQGRSHAHDPSRKFKPPARAWRSSFPRSDGGLQKRRNWPRRQTFRTSRQGPRKRELQQRALQLTRRADDGRKAKRIGAHHHREHQRPGTCRRHQTRTRNGRKVIAGKNPSPRGIHFTKPTTSARQRSPHRRRPRRTRPITARSHPRAKLAR